jgi:hypothetical protein
MGRHDFAKKHTNKSSLPYEIVCIEDTVQDYDSVLKPFTRTPDVRLSVCLSVCPLMIVRYRNSVRDFDIEIPALVLHKCTIPATS